MLPFNIDILLSSVGEDGHVASLFPFDDALYETERLVVPVIAPKSPSCRLTITPKVIKSAKSIFVLAVGEKKGEILGEALNNPHNIFELPVRLTIGSTWILDKSATKSFKAANQNNHHNTRILYA